MPLSSPPRLNRPLTCELQNVLLRFVASHYEHYAKAYASHRELTSYLTDLKNKRVKTLADTLVTPEQYREINARREQFTDAFAVVAYGAAADGAAADGAAADGAAETASRPDFRWIERRVVGWNLTNAYRGAVKSRRRERAAALAPQLEALEAVGLVDDYWRRCAPERPQRGRGRGHP